jgi:hypothetical protein
VEGWLEAARGVERTAEAGEAGDAAVRAEIMVASSSADGGRERERGRRERRGSGNWRPPPPSTDSLGGAGSVERNAGGACEGRKKGSERGLGSGRCAL